MTAQPPLPVAMILGAVPLGLAGELVRDADGGGTVFLHGQASFSWDGGDEAGRRWAAVKLAAMKAAGVGEIAAVFDVTASTVWLWKQLLAEGGIVALVPEKKGPKKASRLTSTVIARIVELRSTGLSQQTVGNMVGVSEFSVRRALKIAAEQATVDATETPTADEAEALETAQQPELPLLPAPVPRSAERAAAGLLEGASPVFSSAARVRHAGLFLALPAMESTGLLSCAK